MGAKRIFFCTSEQWKTAWSSKFGEAQSRGHGCGAVSNWLADLADLHEPARLWDTAHSSAHSARLQRGTPGLPACAGWAPGASGQARSLSPGLAEAQHLTAEPHPTQSSSLSPGWQTVSETEQAHAAGQTSHEGLKSPPPCSRLPRTSPRDSG